MEVRIVVGAQVAYAFIKHDGGSIDVQLMPARSVGQSLLETARDMRAKAAELIRQADLIEMAAEVAAR